MPRTASRRVRCRVETSQRSSAINQPIQEEASRGPLSYRRRMTMARTRAVRLLTVAGAVVGLATAVPAARAEVGVGVGDGDAGAGLVAPDVPPAAAPKRPGAVFHAPFGGHGHGRPDYQPGAPGIGDPYFPLEGNGGYDTQHYDLTFSYDPATDRLEGLAIITAKATQDLSRFDLDLQQLDVSSVTVDAKTASFNRDGQELQITPKNG